MALTAPFATENDMFKSALTLASDRPLEFVHISNPDEINSIEKQRAIRQHVVKGVQRTRKTRHKSTSYTFCHGVATNTLV
jgi:hypothetical protein